ncbi:class I SAM-dependent methyltransferase [Propionivibrio dicarboxylicus]|nr:class I SAM-dependent methyltransferase [Propionivibrio dicarboxylicus]
MFPTAETGRTCITGDIHLVQDMTTGLIFNRSFMPELLEYDQNYQNEQALSPIFRDHLGEVLTIIDRHMANHSLIEVGCGKGVFLEMLAARGYNVTGLDPAYEGMNPRILKKYFSTEVGINADAVILRHVLEHVPNPIDFLKNIKKANCDKGKIYIEVPCFDWICSHRAWFDIFYEHVNYFRLEDLLRMFGRVHGYGHLFGGQYLYIVADIDSLQTPILKNEKGFDFPDDMLDGVSQIAFAQKEMRKTDAAPLIVWGGSSKGVIFSLFMQRAGLEVDYVVDINPAKQGMYIPATGIKVSSPNEIVSKAAPGSTIFVMNGNYLAEIKEMTHHNFTYIAIDHERI